MVRDGMVAEATVRDGIAVEAMLRAGIVALVKEATGMAVEEAQGVVKDVKAAVEATGTARAREAIVRYWCIMFVMEFSE
jgi:hypothetical protein